MFFRDLDRVCPNDSLRPISIQHKIFMRLDLFIRHRFNMDASDVTYMYGSTERRHWRCNLEYVSHSLQCLQESILFGDIGNNHNFEVIRKMLCVWSKPGLFNSRFSADWVRTRYPALRAWITQA